MLNEMDFNASLQHLNQDHFSYINALNDDRLNDRTFCDFAVITQEQTFHVHKCVVGVASEFFKLSMTTNMQEKYQSSVTVNNISDDIMETILSYIYGVQLSITSENIYDLFKASDFLQISRLKTSCIEWFDSQLILSSNNVLFNWTFSKQYNIISFLQKCETYIRANFELTLSQEEFLEIPKEIIEDFFAIRDSSISERTFYESIVKWTKYDPANRQQICGKLFRLIDLDKMEKSYIRSEMLDNDLILNNFESMQHLTKFMKSFMDEKINSPKDQPAIAPSPSKNVSSKYKYLLLKRGVVSLDLYKYNLRTKEKTELSSCEGVFLNVGVAYAKNKLFVMGGHQECSMNSYTNLRSLSLKNPNKNWTENAPMLQKRHRFGCTALENQIYVAGGRAHKTEWLNSVESYDISQDKWTMQCSMSYKRAGCCLVAHDQLLYVLGGSCSSSYFSSMEKFDGYQWKAAESMAMGRSNFAAVVLNDKLYAIGGEDEYEFHQTVEVYDFETGEWSEAATLINRRAGHSACVVGDTIFVAGGHNENGPVKQMELYNPAKNKWKSHFYIAKNAEQAVVVAVR